METERLLALDALGLDESAAGFIRYFKMDHTADVSPPCSSPDAAGCFIAPTDVVSGLLLDRHELTHAFSYELGDPPTFFKEGLAAMLDPTYGDGYVAVEHDVDIGAMMLDESAIDYPVTASFARFLVDEFGWNEFVKFYESVPSSPSLPALQSVFASTFGVSLGSAVDQWKATEWTYRGDAYIWLYECASEPLYLSEGSPTHEDAPPSCADVNLGANHVDDSEGVFRTLEMDRAEGLGIAVESSQSVGVSVTGCDQYIEGEPSGGLAQPERRTRFVLWATLDPGSYFIHAWYSQTQNESLSLTYEVGPHPVGSVCESAGFLGVDDMFGGSRLFFDTANSGIAYMWVKPTTDSTISVQGWSMPHGGGLPDAPATEVDLCVGECGDLVCESGSAWDGWSSTAQFDVVAGERYLLRVELEPDSVAEIGVSREL